MTIATVAALAGTTPAYGDAGVLGPPGPIVRGGTTVETWMGVQVHLNWAYQWLDRGRSWEFGNARLTLRTDGNLVLANKHNGWVYWSTGTAGRGATQLLWQEDGNLVLYTARYERAVWASGTNGDCGQAVPLLGLQQDSNFVIYCALWINGRIALGAIWHTNTAGI